MQKTIKAILIAALAAILPASALAQSAPVKVRDDAKVGFAWTPSADPVDEYVLYVGDSVAAVVKTPSAVVDFSARPAGSYEVSVAARALLAGGVKYDSPKSAPLAVVTVAPPKAPLGLKAVTVQSPPATTPVNLP